LLTGVIAPERFNKEMGDAFHRWASRRAGYIAMANLAAAKQVSDLNTPWRSSAWLYNPYFGSYTYIPFSGRYVGPFGWAYYSPHAVERVYYRPQPVYNGGGYSGGGGMGGYSAADGGSRGYSDMSGRQSMSSSSVSSSAPPPAQATAPAASEARSSDSGSSRGTAGGR
jgi:hypothetical protein